MFRVHQAVALVSRACVVTMVFSLGVLGGQVEAADSAAVSELADRPAVLVHDEFAGESSTTPDDTILTGNSNFKAKQDAGGFQWDINQQGGIGDGSNDCFDGGLQLRVNRNQFNPNDCKMTTDGLEYVFTGLTNNLKITRRVRLDLARGAARYIEVVTNPSPTQPVDVALDVYTITGGTTAGALTSSGKPFSGGALNKDDVGFMTVSQGGSRPSVVFVVCDPWAEIRPSIAVQNNREYTVRYSLKLKPGETQAIVHMVAQRKAGGSAADVASMFEPFFKRRLTDPQVPKSLAELLVNAKVGNVIDGARLTEAVVTVAENVGVERGDQDVLVVGEDASLLGTVTCDGVSVDTVFGPTSVAWDDVALLVGGQGVGAPMCVHLRNGEILNGPVTTASMTMATDAGGGMTLKPDQVDRLVAAVSPRDDHPSRAAAGFVTTMVGDRLAIRRDDAALKMVTPWGTLTTVMHDVASFQSVTEPQPVHVLRLEDGTRMTVMLSGGALQPDTLRFGRIELPPYTVASLTRFRELPDGEDAVEALSVELERRRVAREQAPSVTLVGDNVIVGTITTPTINVLGPVGATAIDTARLESMSKADDGDGPGQFTIVIRGGGTITGRVEQRMLEVTTPQRKWLLPTEHIVEVVVPERQPAGEPDAPLAVEASP